MSSKRELEERLETVASHVVLKEPFRGAVALYTERQVIDHPRLTAATDGKRMLFGLQYCSQLTNEELFGVFLHETDHIVLMHMWRREGRDPARYNIAADIIINEGLRNDKYKLPEGVVYKETYFKKGELDKIDEFNAEMVYRMLPEDAGKRGGGGGDGDGEEWETGGGGFDGCGDLIDSDDPAGAAEAEARITTAAKFAKAAGDRSSLLDRILGGALTPTVPWTEVTRNMLKSASRDDYSYRKYSRRQWQAQGVIIPTLYSESMGGLVVGFDTSGSVTEHEAQQIAGELNGIVDDCDPEWVLVVYCDAEVCGVERFERGDPVELHLKGGGGTRFKPVFDYVEENCVGEEIAGMIYFTDLYGNTEECVEPAFPVIWACTTPNMEDHKLPFGMYTQVKVS